MVGRIGVKVIRSHQFGRAGCPCFDERPLTQELPRMSRFGEQTLDLVADGVLIAAAKPQMDLANRAFPVDDK